MRGLLLPHLIPSGKAALASLCVCFLLTAFNVLSEIEEKKPVNGLVFINGGKKVSVVRV